MQRRLERLRLSDVDLEDTTYCARLEFTDEEIQSLAESIESMGLRNPPGYVRKGGKLIVNFGWRRTLAMKRLGREELDAWVYEGVSDRDLHLQNLSDNQDRDDLSVLELAGKVKTLRDLEIPVSEIAKSLGRGSQHVYDLLKLMEMPHEIQRATHSGNITLYQAREIYKFDASKHLEILQRTLDEKLSVGALKRLRRGDSSGVSVETEETLRRIIADSAEKGVEITYDELLSQVGPQESSELSESSRRIWRSHRGWVVDVPYDWKSRQEERLGGKVRFVTVEERDDGSLIVSPKEEET